MNTMREVSNSEDVIDSRDILARIEELEGYDKPSEPEQDELKLLKALSEEAEGYSEDWKYGAALIRDSYFEDYARELAKDIGAIKDDMAWPLTCIDWAEAAEQLQQDYTQVDFDGVSYWVR